MYARLKSAERCHSVSFGMEVAQFGLLWMSSILPHLGEQIQKETFVEESRWVC